MSDDFEDPPQLYRGREVEKSDLQTHIEAENPGHSELGKGLAYLGLGVILFGLVSTIPRLPADLSETTAKTLQPAVTPMMIGVALLALGGAVAVLLSPPLMRVWRSIYTRLTGSPSGGDPLADGGEADD